MGVDVDKNKGGTNAGAGNNPRQRKKQYEAAYERLYRRKLREKRASAASKWSVSVMDASSRVAGRNDPVTRRNFMGVLGRSAVPREFAGTVERLLELQNGGGGNNADGDGDGRARLNGANFSLFSLFWVQMSAGLGGSIGSLLR